MTNTNYTYYDEATISKTRGASFKVELEEHEITIIVPTSTVEAICKETVDDEAMIATLLAYIEATRKSVKVEGNNIRRIKEETLINSIIKLLVWYPVEQLIEFVIELKWHQIKQVFEANNPKKEIEQFV